MEKKRRSEYEATAMLLGMTYDEQYHVIWTENRKGTATNGPSLMLDPETMRPLSYLDIQYRFRRDREYPPEIDDG